MPEASATRAADHERPGQGLPAIAMGSAMMAGEHGEHRLGGTQRNFETEIGCQDMARVT